MHPSHEVAVYKSPERLAAFLALGFAFFFFCPSSSASPSSDFTDTVSLLLEDFSPVTPLPEEEVEEELEADPSVVPDAESEEQHVSVLFVFILS